MSCTKSTAANPLSGITCGSIQVCAILLLISAQGFGQRKYYEYNNPDALKLNRRRLEMLTAAPWDVKELRMKIRGDQSTYRSTGTLIYKTDGGYTNGRISGKWKVKYDRYLVLTPDSGARRSSGSLAGIYSVISISDSTLTLTKLHSSSRDMTSKFSLVRRSKHNVGNAPTGYKVSHAFNHRLSPSEIDSLTFLSLENLFISNMIVIKDTLRVSTVDSLYRIKMKIGDPLRKVKIFSESESPGYRVDMKRFTMPADQIPQVDSLALTFIQRQSDSTHHKIFSTEPYFRQYVGYDDGRGNNIILLNAFCGFHGDWRSTVIRNPRSCYFRMYVNVTTGECFGLNARK